MYRVVILVATLALMAANAVIVFAESDQDRAQTANPLLPANYLSHAVGLDSRLRGYPVFVIRMSDDAIETPVTAVPGRTLVIEENTGSTDGHVFVMRVPDDITNDQLEADLAGTETPEWFYRGQYAGNPDRAAPGETGMAGLIDLVLGRYIVVDPLHPKAPARFDVLPADNTVVDQPDPEADVVAEMHEMDFDLPDEVPAGRTVWQVINTGALPHEIALSPVPAGATADDVQAAMTALLNGESVPAELGAEWADWDAPLVNGVGVTSAGGSVWAQFNLEPGTYAAICFFPGANGPHLMEGMIRIVSVVG